MATVAPSEWRREPSAGLPPVVERLLMDLIGDGFVVYCCGDRTAPAALVASYEWPDYVDIATIRDFDRITTARVPKQDKVDVFAPESVVWAYEGPAEQALQALLDLVHPQHPDAPRTFYPAPGSLRIPRAEQRPMAIRPPAPGRASVRAARLAAEGVDGSGAQGTMSRSAGQVTQATDGQSLRRAACSVSHRDGIGSGGR